MNKKAKTRLFVLLTPVALLYYFSPPRNFIIQIDAKPQGVEEFYVEITSSRANAHGRTVKYVAKQVVPSNQKTTILLNREKLLWFSNVTAKIYHPEYFRETEGASNNYFLPSLKVAPIAWADALAKSPRWALESSYSYSEKLTGRYITARLAHRIIYMSEVHNHIISMNGLFKNPDMQNVDAIKLGKSIEVLDLIVQEFDAGMLEESNPYLGPTEWVQKHIDETHSALAEIHEEFN